MLSRLRETRDGEVRGQTLTEMALARDNRIPVVVFSIRQAGAFVDILKGPGRATIVADA